VEQPLGDGDESSADPHEPARALRGVGPFIILLLFLDPPSPFFLGSTVAGRATSFAVRGTVVRWTPAARLALDTTLLRPSAPRLILCAAFLRAPTTSLVLRSPFRDGSPVTGWWAEAAASVPGAMLFGTARRPVCRGTTAWRPSCFAALGCGFGRALRVFHFLAIGVARLGLAAIGAVLLSSVVAPVVLAADRAGHQEHRHAQPEARRQSCDGRAGPWRQVVHRRRQKM
jgi:hypothetical protein